MYTHSSFTYTHVYMNALLTQNLLLLFFFFFLFSFNSTPKHMQVPLPLAPLLFTFFLCRCCVVCSLLSPVEPTFTFSAWLVCSPTRHAALSLVFVIFPAVLVFYFFLYIFILYLFITFLPSVREHI